ncbi:MAG: hypothetical protein KBE65_11035 [Phycisphaerae bacterium]|nr:hypothetical protein [Phycisphaerae bacterium]
MYKKTVGLSVCLILTMVAPGALAQNPNVEVSALNSVADLDLSGEIVYAINFGDTGNPKLGDVVFTQEEDHPNVTCAISAEGRISAWGGVYPNTGDSHLDALLGGLIWTNDGPGRCTTAVAVGGLLVGASYRLQIISYDGLGHSRSGDIIVEGDKILENWDVFAAQGSISGKGGSVVIYIFTAGDSTLNIAGTPIPDDGSMASGFSGLILTKLSGPTFADYGSGTTTELVSGKGTWQINWGQGPWTWSTNEGDALFGSNVSSVLALHTTAAAAVSADLVATLPVQGDLTLTARDKSNGNVVIGTMSLSGTGVNIIDINASRVLVDEGSGMGMGTFHPPGPELAMTLNEATGVFAYIRQSGDWRLELAGLYAMPLITGSTLQNSILAALGGKVPLIGGLATFALSGEYDPVESMKPQSFCEYGTGVAASFGAAGGLWEQTWSGGPWSWHTCPATVNAQFLGDNVSGQLETTTTSSPTIGADMVLRSGFIGTITLTAGDGATREEVDGQIKGDVTGSFVGDVNAANATFDADGNIVCSFGVSVNDAPDALITVTEATGKYADIRQAGQWGWYVNGKMTIARVPDLPIQQNILAALQKPELLLGAQEEFVLTGWYYRQTQ